jgi:hypothetical protein
MKKHPVMNQYLKTLQLFLVNLLTVRAGLYIKQTPSNLKKQ